MVAGLQAQGPFAGVYVSLHGAMAVRGVMRPEAEIARRVRAVVGPSCKIVGTFDPHGNEDEAFLQSAAFAFTSQYFPHYDEYVQSTRAARMLIRAIRGDFAPTHATVKVPILTPTVLQWTGASPWMDLVQRALTWEAREPDVFINFFFGFPRADTPDAGMTLQATTNGDQALAERVADDMAQAAWRARDALIFSTKIHAMKEGVALAKTSPAKIVLADCSDRSGAATWLLGEILLQDLENVLIATVKDGDVLDRLHASAAKPGDDFGAPVGGRVDPSAGDPVRVTGRILGIDTNWATIAFGQDSVLVISRFLTQIIEPATLRNYRLEPDNFAAFAIKSRVHFRRGFDDSGYAKTILLVEPSERFMGTVGLETLLYKNIVLNNYFPYGRPNFA